MPVKSKMLGERAGNSKYGQIVSGKWYEVPYRWRLGCCDCGLVHDMNFRIRTPKGSDTAIVEVQILRNDRATGGKRRAKGVKVVKVRKNVKNKA